MSGPRPDWQLASWDEVAGDRAGDPDRRPAPAGTFGLRVRSVSEVARAIRDLVRADEGLRDVWVEGEVGRVTVSTAGHAYFTLKDSRSQLQCVWFRDERARSPFQPQTGLQVVAHGRIDLFEPQGALQLYVESLQPSGLGNLAVEFEERKARLAAEGLFDTARKRPLPPRPRVIAVVTSPSGAVWRDVCNVVARRWPLTRVVLVACRVQGEGSAASIVTALRRLDRWIGDVAAAGATDAGAADEVPAVTILARGGGSMEDLWSFNDEQVVRAIVAHRVPVVSGIGHEVDVTLADFAADVRAPTPSAAAELVVPDRADALAAVALLGRRAATALGSRLTAARRDTAGERRALARLEPRAHLAELRERADRLLDRAAGAVAGQLAGSRAVLGRMADRAPRVVERRLGVARGSLAATRSSLAALAPEATLRRGYAIARRGDDGTILRDPAAAPAGTGLRLTLAEGTLAATSDGPAGEEGSPAGWAPRV